jgi:hypothetical protein
MRLIIPVAIHIVQKVGGRSPKAGIPPLVTERLNSKPFKGVIKTTTATWRELNELLDPIKENRCRYHEEAVFPIQRPFNKRRQTYAHHRQRKKVTPYKFQRLLGFTPNVLDAIHRLPLLSSLILTQVFPKKPLKNNIFFKKRGYVWP